MKGRRDRATTDVRVFVRGVLRVLRLLRAHRLQPRTLRGLMEILPLLVSNVNATIDDSEVRSVVIQVGGVGVGIQSLPSTIGEGGAWG